MIKAHLASFGGIFLSAWFYSAAAIAAPQTGNVPPQAPVAVAQESSASPAEQVDLQSPQAQAAQESTHKTQQTPAAQTDPKSSEKKGEWLLAPIPISSPAIGSGLEFAVARLFPFSKKDEISPPSAVGVGGVITNNGSRAIAVGGRLYLKEDKYRVAVGFAKASVNFDVYGVGSSAGSEGVFVPLNVKGGVGIGELLYRLKKSIYVGARGQYRNARLSINQDEYDSSDVTAQPPEQVAKVLEQIGDQLLQQTTVSLGPRFQWDTRDSTFYPKRGLLAEVASDFFSTGLGSKWSYQYYKASINKYQKLSENQILAFRGMGCAAAGERVPIYDLCLFGTSNDLRGYTGGRYQDRRMFATQAEYRLMLPSKGFMGRFGLVAFAGVGAVGKTFGDMAFDDLLPAGGGGVRFRLLKKYPVNFRIDYGQGRDGHTLSIGVMEAF